VTGEFVELMKTKHS